MSEPLIGERIGSGKEAEVFAQGEHVLKLYRHASAKAAAFGEAAILAAIERTGLPVPKVVEVGRYGERWGLVMTRADGSAFGTTMAADPRSVPAHLVAMARLQSRIHECRVSHLPSLGRRLALNIERAPGLAPALRQRLLSGLAQLPRGDSLCHGDFHPNNIIGSPAAAVIVDWLDAAAGPPAADLCRSHLLMAAADPALAEAYLEAAIARTGIARAEVEHWRPIIAAARLAENVPAEAESLQRMASALPTG